MTSDHARRPRPEAVLAASPLWDGLDGGTLVVACSGGADSVGLLRAAHALLQDPIFSARFGRPPTLLAWHLDHRMRATSGSDAQFVAALCSEMHIPLVAEAVSAPFTGVAGANAEAVARKVRYSLLLKLLREPSPELSLPQPRLALTAHHLGDQAETILHHLVRGTHLSGIRGIHAVRNGCIQRPWLSLHPEEIRSYLQHLGQGWCEDDSNADIRLTRNRLRHLVIPELLQINPRAREHIARLAATAELVQSSIETILAELEVEQFTSHDLHRWLPLIGWQQAEYHLHRNEQGSFLAADLLARYVWGQLQHLAGTLDNSCWHRIYEWALRPQRELQLRDWRIRLLHERVLAVQGHVEEAERLPQGQLTAGQSLHIGGLEASLQRCAPEFWQAERHRQRHHWERISDWGLTMDCLSASPPIGPAWHCALPQNVEPPLQLRQPAKGERIGLRGGGSKLLSDVFIDAKVPRCFRRVWTVLADTSGTILWLPGLADSSAMHIEEGQRPHWLLTLRDISAHDRET